MNQLYLYLGLYILFLLILSWYISRKHTSEDFLISGRDRKGWHILLSKFAGSIGASWFVSYTAYAYEFGFWIYALLVGVLIGYFMFAYWAAPRIYKYSKEKQFYTQGDFVYNSTNSTFAKYVANWITILTNALWVLLGIVAGAKIVSHFGLIGYEVAVILTVFVVLAYILLAGYKAVIVTDIIQSIVIMVLLAVLSFALVSNSEITTILSAQTSRMGIAAIIGFLLYGLVSVFAQADRYQLCYAAQSEKKLKRGIGFAVIPVIIAASFLLLIGLFVFTKNPSMDPGLVFLEALRLYLPAALLPLGIVLFFAGLMSSVDTSIYAISSHVVLSRNSTKPVYEVRLTTIILLILITLLAFVFRDIVDITILAAALTLVLSVPMIYLILGNKNSGRFIGSIVGGLIGLGLALYFIGLDPAAAILVLLGGCVGLFYRKNRK